MYKRQPYKFITKATNPQYIYTFIKLIYSDQTLILDCEYNEISIDDLEIGDKIVAFHSNVMTMSIPPQTQVYIIEVK
ncbi:hypothetical protein [Paraclostridium bifermentans]|uniref:hypothetical protein n=1 Tax=Paraclostridium bifermentans TaxID=1490 RepID=UPI001C824EC8|nr:hypothetical protein [Paraclostridium bifermentans]GIM33836.1 hypothetical protein PAGU1678_31050 [Paraclostridium bifermentans subsp. muricolitidis]